MKLKLNMPNNVSFFLFVCLFYQWFILPNGKISIKDINEGREGVGGSSSQVGLTLSGA